MSRLSKRGIACLLVALVGHPWSDPAIGHPMDSYAIDQYVDFLLEGETIALVHRIEFAEIPTASELPRIDSNRDMLLSAEETIPYVQQTVQNLLEEIVLTIDDERVVWDYQRGEAFLDTLPSTRLKMVSEYRADLPADLGEGKVFRLDLRHRPTARGDRQTRIVCRGKVALSGVGSSENIQPPGMAPPAVYETAALVYGHRVQWTLIPSEKEAPLEIPDFSIRDATAPTAPPNPFLALNDRALIEEILGEGSEGEPESSPPVDSATATANLREVAQPVVAEGDQSKSKETWADREFRQMFLQSGTGKASIWALLGFTLLSLLYGAAHALEPGHGKTVVAAYLVGAHGTVFHAVLLALIVTFTHTFSVYILGIIALTNLEKVQGTYLPILECGSWFLILCMGIWLFLRYYKYYVQGKLADPTFHTHGFGEGHSHVSDHDHPHPHDHTHGHDHHHPHDHHHEHPHPHEHSHEAHHHHAAPAHKHTHDHGHSHSHEGGHGHSHSHDHPHNHSHDHGHAHPHHHDHDHDHPHPHPHPHHHDHPHPHPHSGKGASEVSFWNLLTLGVTGGIVPCPGALFVMMIALTSGAVWTGLYLITVFSVGLALTLMGVGIAVVKGRGAIDRFAPNSKWVQVLPVCTSLVIAFIGLAFFINGLAKHGILVLNF